MGHSRTAWLLHRVAVRLRLIALSRSTYVALMAAAALYGVLLLLIRLTGLIPDFLTPLTLLAVPTVALLVAVVWHARPSVAESAHTVDEWLGTKDLFLTAALIENTPGHYQPLVLRAAEEKAAVARPQVVAPLRGWERTGHATIVMLVLLAAVSWFPRFDPFGKRQAYERLTERKELLKTENQHTLRRAKALGKDDLESEMSKETRNLIDELKKNFNSMKPQDPAGNLRKLAEQRFALETEWRRANEQKLKDRLASKSTAQRFGGAVSSQAQQWTNQLQAGKATGMKQQVAQLQQKVEQLAAATDPLQQQQLQKQIKQGLEELADFAAMNPNAGALGNVMSQALSQLDMSALDGLSGQSMEALGQSLSLSQMELESLGQSMRDLQALQQALSTCQMAAALNQLQPLNGQACGQCQGLGDYALLYQQLLSQYQGLGMGGPGQGRGNIALEDPTQKNQFQTQRSRSALTAGKILLTWKTKEVSDPGEAVKDYAKAVERVRQGASEAVLQEQIPPGYHEAIRTYFKSIDEKSE